MQYLRPKVWASSSCGHRWRLRSGDPEALLCWCVTGAAAGAAGLPELWGEPKKPSLWMSRQGCRHTPSSLNPILTEPRPGSPALGPLPSSHGFCLGLSNLRLSGLKSPWQIISAAGSLIRGQAPLSFCLSCPLKDLIGNRLILPRFVAPGTGFGDISKFIKVSGKPRA